jgi:hypothetical protein
MRLILAACLTALSNAAYAGCANYTDGSLPDAPPEVVTCYDGECELTTVDYHCGNAHGAQFGYANGWKAAISEDGALLAKDEEPRDPDKFAVYSEPFRLSR